MWRSLGSSCGGYPCLAATVERRGKSCPALQTQRCELADYSVEAQRQDQDTVEFAVKVTSRARCPSSRVICSMRMRRRGPVTCPQGQFITSLLRYLCIATLRSRYQINRRRVGKSVSRPGRTLALRLWKPRTASGQSRPQKTQNNTVAASLRAMVADSSILDGTYN